MKAAVCEWVIPQNGVAAVYAAGQLGFDGIQITEQGGMDKGFPLLDPEVQEAYKKAVAESGVELQALHLWSLCRLAVMLHPLDSEPGRIALDYIEKSLKSCEQMGIPKLLMTSGVMAQAKNRKDYLIFGRYMKAACDMAEGTGVGIVFESAFKADEIEAMVDLTGGRLKVCYDLFNPVRFHMNDPLEDIRYLAPKGCIDHYHVKDGPSSCIGCSLLGEGIGGFTAAMDAICKSGYDGWLVSENYYVDMAAQKEYAGRTWEELAGADVRTLDRYC